MKRMLLVDDHVAVRRGLSDMLTSEMPELQIGFADSEVEALRQATEFLWDMAIVDLSLKSKSGLDLIGLLKDRQPQIRILIYSMYPESQFGVRALRAGAYGYLTKDAEPEELIRAVKRILSGSRYISPGLAEHLAEAVVSNESEQPHLLLSSREDQVLRGLAAGKSLTQIGEELNVSVKTISTYRTRILEKLHVGNNSEIVRYALEHKLI
ncbi:MAG TPA: response regulator transcription factor [Bryobacteraceae bacterium]|jgi:Response regulator containing a CheY-like receiver domain and an HTH DNA-binding domain|nr:response regulator transcription factor [Bryobacteraceae bacterium]